MIHTLFLALSLSLAQPAPAAPADPAVSGIPGLPPGPAPAPEAVPDLTRAIAKGVKCPVCQGMSVADSNSEAAVNMYRRIEELVGMGYTEEQIQDFFIDRYGEVILLEPQRKGMNQLLYIAPFGAAGLGGAWIMSVVASWRREDDDVPLPSDLGKVEMDPYEARLLAELEAEDE